MSVIEIVVWGLVIAAVPVMLAVWALSMRWRMGRITGGWRHLFVVLCLLATWYVAMTFVVLFGGQTVAGVMLSVLWVVGGLSWGAITLGSGRHGSRLTTTTTADASDAFAQVMERKRRARSHAMSVRGG